MSEGAITFLDGDPGCGKSSIAFDLAARVSVGNKLPEGGKTKPGGAILCIAEDDPANLAVPRLAAAGADLRRCHFFGLSASETILDLPRFPAAASSLKRLIERTEARIVVVDPYMPFLERGLNPYIEQDVRNALQPVAMVAQQTGCAILMIRHLTKQTGAKKIYRGGGSIGITAIARTVLAAGYHPNDPDLRLLSVIKNNLGAMAPPLAYSIEPRGGSSGVRWHGVADVNDDDPVAESEAKGGRAVLEEAKALLEQALKEGARAARDLIKEAEDNGIGRRTLCNAKAALAVESRRKTNTDGKGYWEWLWPSP